MTRSMGLGPFSSACSPERRSGRVPGPALLEALDDVFRADPGIDELGVVMASASREVEKVPAPSKFP